MYMCVCVCVCVCVCMYNENLLERQQSMFRIYARERAKRASAPKIMKFQVEISNISVWAI